jgi:hypothetical protein
MRRFSIGLMCILCFVLVLPAQAQDQRCVPEIEALQPDPAAAQGVSGNGEYVSGTFTPARLGPIPYNMSHTSESNFAVWLRCAGGDDLAVNEIGTYTGSVVVDFEQGPCFWDVVADGTWSATPK